MPSSRPQGTVDEDIHREEWTAEERLQIVEETNQILADPAFKSSKRCRALFSRLVDRSLAGDHDAVKERTLGVEVFGRAPHYDTATDPVVRMTANEIRKRLAQWYQESPQYHPVKVRLNAGTYLLKFEFTQPDPALGVSEAKPKIEDPVALALLEAASQDAQQAEGHTIPESGTQPEVTNPSLAAVARSRNKWIWGAAAIAILALAAVLSMRYLDVFETRDYLAWKPLLNPARPLTLIIPDGPPLDIPDGNSDWQLNADSIANHVSPGDSTVQESARKTSIADAESSQRITRWLAAHGRKPVLRGSSTMNLRDLREGPVVLIGGFNPWSLILLSNLRYSIRVDPVTKAMWIQDAQNTSKRDWIIDGKNQPKNVDYALVSRFTDAETGNWVLSVGGLRPQGTQAASDLLVDSPFAQLLPKQIASKGNFQIVLKTNIVNGSAGPPQVIAVHTW